MGLPVYYGTIYGVVMVEGFIATTLDTAVRLNRYLFEELWRVLIPKTPAFMKSYYFNAALVVFIMYWLARTNAFKALWPIFGAGNQLLAALALTVISAWLIERRKPSWFTIIPGIFMLVTTVTALIWLLVNRYIPTHNMTLIIADVLMVALALGTVILAMKTALDGKHKTDAPAPA
jgi:carbon starvation protein